MQIIRRDATRVFLLCVVTAVVTVTHLWAAERTNPGKNKSDATKTLSPEGLPFLLQLKENRLTIEAEAVALGTVLQGISQVTGIEFSPFKPLTGEVTTNLVSVSVEEALQRLLGVNNYALLYSDEGGRRRIDKVLVLSDGNEGLNSPGGDSITTHAQAPTSAKGADSQNPGRQKEMIEALVQWGDEQAVDFFLKGDPEVYQIAITALQIAMNSEDPRVKANAQSLIQRFHARLQSGDR